MTVAACGPFLLGTFGTASDTTNVGTTFNSANDSFGWVIESPRSGTIKTVTVYFSSCTTPDTMQVGIQNIDASGLPDGANDAYRTFTTAAGFVQTGDITNTGADGGTKKTTTAGEMLAFVFTYPSFVAGNCVLSSSRNNTLAGPNSGGYLVSAIDGVAWAMGTTTAGPLIAIEWTDGYKACFIDPGTIMERSPTGNSTDSATWASASDDTTTTGFGDEYAIRIIPNYDLQCSGARIIIDADTDLTVKLYNSGGTVLASFSVDKDARAVNTQQVLHAYWDAVTLTAGQTYYLSVAIGGTTTACKINGVRTSSADTLKQTYPSGLATLAHAYRSDGGSWKIETAQLFHIKAIITGIDSGSSGGLLGPNMRGFFQ